jgi:hypothetical protein
MSEAWDRAVVEGWRNRSFVVGLVAIAVCVVGAYFNWAEFFPAYLFAYLFVLGLALGSLALVMIQHLTGGAWTMLVRHIAEAQMKTLPLLALLFVPIVFGLTDIYQWASRPSEKIEAPRTFWQSYLEPRFFCWRAVAYFAVWLLLVWLLNSWSRKHDRSGEVRIAWKLYKLSGPGLVLFGIALHFAAIDWLMSLQTGFTSTIFGPLLFSSQLLSAYALTVLVFCGIATRAEFEPVLSKKAMNDLGSLLFTLLVLWAYMVWFQFMLVWIAHLPDETIWYAVRSRGAWPWLVWFLLIFQFVIPFFLLLLRTVKEDRRSLAAVAGLILAMQVLFMYYLVIPVFEAASIAQHWIDVVMPIGVGGIWLACFLRQIMQQPLLPSHDLNYSHAIHLHELDRAKLAREEALAHA